jgi:hypothetical protein
LGSTAASNALANGFAACGIVVGVSKNVIETSWLALADSCHYFLARA